MKDRLQKIISASGLMSRRAAEECITAGRVSVNGKDVKPSYNLKVGDVVELRFGGGTLKFRVLILKETVKKEEAPTLYEIINE